jgi:hypothetical protein
MNRRDLMRRLGLAAASLPWAEQIFAVGALDSPVRPSSATFKLTGDMRRVMATIADLIIPPTETAGASGAGVVDFIDMMLASWFSPAERADFLGGIGSLDPMSRAQSGAGFLSAGAENQSRLLTLLETQALQNDGTLDPRAWVARLKLLVLTGYYTSEVGASVELDNTMIFASFDGCIELGPDDRAQSTTTPAPRSL